MLIIEKFRKRRILVVGDIILDRFIFGDVSRISPEAPVPVVKVSGENFKPGGAANVAVNLATLGVKTHLIGTTGNDYYGNFFMGLLKKYRIRTEGITRSSVPTTIKTRIIARNQQVVRVDRESDGKGRNSAAIISAVKKIIKKTDAVIIADYGKGVITSELLGYLIPACLKMKKIITVDPQFDNFMNYKNVTCLTPNHFEASLVSGMKAESDSQVKTCGQNILKKLNARSLIITRGEKGMAVFEKNKTTFIATSAKEVYDVTGAGDTVIAVLTAVLACGEGILKSASIANKAAGIVVGKFGTASVTREELSR